MRSLVRFSLRLTGDMYEVLLALSIRNRRSLHAEIMSLLDEAIFARSQRSDGFMAPRTQGDAS